MRQVDAFKLPGPFWAAMGKAQFRLLVLNDGKIHLALAKVLWPLSCLEGEVEELQFRFRREDMLARWPAGERRSGSVDRALSELYEALLRAT